MRFAKVFLLWCAAALLAGVIFHEGSTPTDSTHRRQLLADGTQPLPTPPLLADGTQPLPTPPMVADGTQPLPTPPLFHDGTQPLPTPPAKSAKLTLAA